MCNYHLGIFLLLCAIAAVSQFDYWSFSDSKQQTPELSCIFKKFASFL
ncbi:hypothetical protein [Nostoc sp.]